MSGPCEAIRRRLLAGDASPELSEHARSCLSCGPFSRALGAVDRGLRALGQEPPPEIPPFSALDLSSAQHRTSTARWAAGGVAIASLAIAATIAIFVLRLPTLQPGATLETRGKARAQRLSDGTEVTLLAGHLRFAESSRSERRLELDDGAVLLRVPRLPAGARLTVRTDEADVVVHGTHFLVERSSGRTRVTVTAGSVEVTPHGKGRPSVLLGPAQTEDVESLERYRLTRRALALQHTAAGRYAEGAREIEALLATEPQAELAGEAHALRGWQAEAMGDVARATGEYRSALRAAPPEERAVWMENSAAGLAQLLEKAGARDEARTVWRDYLQKFPDGIHAVQARRHLTVSAP